MKGIKARIICIITFFAVFAVGIIFQYFERSYKSFEVIYSSQTTINLDSKFKIVSSSDLIPENNLTEKEEIKNTKNDEGETYININTADIKELERLNGIGEKLAKRIIDYRNSNGRFEVIEDIMKVSGIGTKTFEKIKNEISVQ